MRLFPILLFSIDMVDLNGIQNSDAESVDRDFDSTQAAVTRSSQSFSEGDPLTFEDSWQISFEEAQRTSFGQVLGDPIFLNGINNLRYVAVTR